MKKQLSLFSLIMLCCISAYTQQRIITAGSSSSEIVCALGLCDNIVATDRTSLYPEKLQALPTIGYRSDIGAEGIISQRPDLVIFEEGYVKDEVISQLQSTGIKILIVKQESNLANTEQRIRQIARAIDRTNEGERLIADINAGLDKVEKLVKGSGSTPKVLCVYNRGRGNMMVAGKNTPFTLLEYAGAVNAVPEIDGFKPLNAESLILANPDYILFFESGIESLGGMEGVLAIPGVRQTNAGKKGQIIAMDGILLTNWGPRVADAAMELFIKTHPESAN